MSIFIQTWHNTANYCQKCQKKWIFLKEIVKIGVRKRKNVL